MSSSISNATQTPTDVVTLQQVRRPSAPRKETPSGKAPQRSTASNITLPEDVVTLSTSSRSKAEASLLAKKKPSLPVTADEKQALLSAGSDKNGFSIHV